jgi:hypothetical protein
MRSSELNQKLGYAPWLPKLNQVPHLTIETNMTCNIKCKLCYNHNHEYVKALQQVKNEVDTGLSIRHADTVSLLGGEPLLHPDIQEIVRYIKGKRVVCQLLTNGLCLLKEGSESLIEGLIAAGLDRFIVHIDKGQDVYPDAYQAIHQVLTKLEPYKIMVSISWTVYYETAGALPEVIKEFSRYKNFDGLLSVLAKDINQRIQPGIRENHVPLMINEYNSLKSAMSLEPSVYLPSNLSNEHIKWFLYVYFINIKTQRTFFVSPRIARIFQNYYLKFALRIFFRKKRNRGSLYTSLIMSGFIEMLLKPSRMKDYFRMLKQSRGMKEIRFQYINIQDGPEYDPEFGQISMCYHCPDGTVRNGKITPVCLADRISPLPGSMPPDNVPEGLRELVYEHLGQLN